MKDNKKPTKKRDTALILLILLLVASFAYLFWYNSTGREVQEVSYSRFVQLVESRAVERITFQEHSVFGKLRGGEKYFVASTMVTPDLIEKARKSGADVVVNIGSKGGGGISFPLILLIGLLIIILVAYFKRIQGASGGRILSVGKSRAKFFSPNEVKVTFKDVAGVEEVKEELRDIVEFLKNPAKFERLGAKVPRGVLLSGAPGTGKTLLAKAVAGEAGRPFFSISGSDFVEVFVGVGASRVRDLFTQARKHAPCIVFIDEIDAVGRQRGVGLGGGNDEREQTLNQLLAEMDGFSTEHGSVIVLAATNRPDVLDKALLRPGRFDRVIEVPYPDLMSRKKILEVHAKNVILAKDVDLMKIARGTPGFTGADLENLINEAALLASKLGKNAVSMEDFEKARDKIVLGSERKTVVMSEKERERTAYHEAGHALVTMFTQSGGELHKVTIVPRGRALGVSWSMPAEEKWVETRSELLDKIAVSLGGMAAELLIYGEMTTGASNDIEHASSIARRMVKRFGMSKLGPVVFGSNTDHPYLGRDLLAPTANYSEATAEEIDHEVIKIVRDSLERARQILSNHRDGLEKLAKRLLEIETVMGEEAYRLVGLEPPKENRSFLDADSESGGKEAETPEGGSVKNEVHTGDPIFSDESDDEPPEEEYGDIFGRDNNEDDDEDEGL